MELHHTGGGAEDVGGSGGEGRQRRRLGEPALDGGPDPRQDLVGAIKAAGGQGEADAGLLEAPGVGFGVDAAGGVGGLLGAARASGEEAAAAGGREGEVHQHGHAAGLEDVGDAPGLDTAVDHRAQLELVGEAEGAPDFQIGRAHV